MLIKINVDAPCVSIHSSSSSNSLYDANNAPPHRFHAATQSLINAEVIVTVLKWPAVFPDQNPIEHIWGFVKQELWKRPRASNSNELFQILVDI